MKKFVFVLLSIGLIIYSCKKSSDNSPSKTEIITSATWKYDTAAIDFNKDGKPETQIPPGTIATCKLDNIITFKKDSTGILDEGATKCTSTDPQTTAFTWYFKNNNDSLYSPNPIFGGLSGSAKVSVLTSTKLEVIKEVTITGYPGTVNVVLDLKH